MKGPDTSKSSFKLVVIGWVSDPGCKWLYPAEGTPGFLVGGGSILVLLIGVQLLRYPNAHMPSSTVLTECSPALRVTEQIQTAGEEQREHSVPPLHRGLMLKQYRLKQVRITERWLCMALVQSDKSFLFSVVLRITEFRVHWMVSSSCN